MMMDAIVAAGSKIKLSFYHETEREQRPSPDRIKADLDYLKKWYAWHPACAHIDDRPVIFVFNSDGCNVAERWMEASNNEWYVVLKIFPGFQYCAVQPDHWVRKAISHMQGFTSRTRRPYISHNHAINYHSINTESVMAIL
jgi:hypothetical protein